MNEGGDPTTESIAIGLQNKWFRLGLAIAVIQTSFLVTLLILLQLNVALALIVAVTAGILGGIALMIFVLYIY